MKLVDVINANGGQMVQLPTEFRFSTARVSIRKEGEAVILEPLKPAAWPPGFFETIQIDDPTFVRPNQGVTPPPPQLN